MNGYDLTLSCGPPILAIALQKWSLPTNAALEKYARDEQDRLNLTDAAGQVLESSLKGVVSINGLAATFVSFPSGIFALFYSVKDGLIFVYSFLIVGIIVILWMLSLVNGRTPYELVQSRVKSFWPQTKSHFFSFTMVDVIAWTVYVINFMIVALSFSLFFAEQHGWIRNS